MPDQQVEGQKEKQQEMFNRALSLPHRTLLAQPHRAFK